MSITNARLIVSITINVNIMDNYSRYVIGLIQFLGFVLVSTEIIWNVIRSVERKTVNSIAARIWVFATSFHENRALSEQILFRFYRTIITRTFHVIDFQCGKSRAKRSTVLTFSSFVSRSLQKVDVRDVDSVGTDKYVSE